VSVDAMTVHDADTPEVLDSSEILRVEIGVLVHLSHLRNKACSCFVANTLYYLLALRSISFVALGWPSGRKLASLDRHGVVVPSDVHALRFLFLLFSRTTGLLL